MIIHYNLLLNNIISKKKNLKMKIFLYQDLVLLIKASFVITPTNFPQSVTNI